MPYHCEKRDCKQSDGSSGTYVMIKDSTGEAVSCHTDRQSCESAIYAIEQNEKQEKIDELKVLIFAIIDEIEELAKNET